MSDSPVLTSSGGTSESRFPRSPRTLFKTAPGSLPHSHLDFSEQSDSPHLPGGQSVRPLLDPDPFDLGWFTTQHIPYQVQIAVQDPHGPQLHDSSALADRITSQPFADCCVEAQQLEVRITNLAASHLSQQPNVATPLFEAREHAARLEARARQQRLDYDRSIAEDVFSKITHSEVTVTHVRDALETLLYGNIDATGSIECDILAHQLAEKRAEVAASDHVIMRDQGVPAALPKIDAAIIMLLSEARLTDRAFHEVAGLTAATQPLAFANHLLATHPRPLEVLFARYRSAPLDDDDPIGLLDETLVSETLLALYNIVRAFADKASEDRPPATEALDRIVETVASDLESWAYCLATIPSVIRAGSGIDIEEAIDLHLQTLVGALFMRNDLESLAAQILNVRSVIVETSNFDISTRFEELVVERLTHLDAETMHSVARALVRLPDTAGFNRDSMPLILTAISGELEKAKTPTDPFDSVDTPAAALFQAAVIEMGSTWALDVLVDSSRYDKLPRKLEKLATGLSHTKPSTAIFQHLNDTTASHGESGMRLIQTISAILDNVLKGVAPAEEGIPLPTDLLLLLGRTTEHLHRLFESDHPQECRILPLELLVRKLFHPLLLDQSPPSSDPHPAVEQFRKIRLDVRGLMAETLIRVLDGTRFSSAAGAPDNLRNALNELIDGVVRPTDTDPSLIDSCCNRLQAAIQLPATLSSATLNHSPNDPRSTNSSERRARRMAYQTGDRSWVDPAPNSPAVGVTFEQPQSGSSVNHSTPPLLRT